MSQITWINVIEDIAWEEWSDKKQDPKLPFSKLGMRVLKNSTEDNDPRSYERAPSLIKTLSCEGESMTK